MTPQRFNREIRIYPGKDDRASGNGWSCAELMFVLTDLEVPGAATFAVRTNWLPDTMERGAIRPSASLTPIDLIFHFPVPTLTASQDKRDICPYVGGACYSVTDRKSMPGLLQVLQGSGTEVLWPLLERLFDQEARINRPRLKGAA